MTLSRRLRTLLAGLLAFAVLAPATGAAAEPQPSQDPKPSQTPNKQEQAAPLTLSLSPAGTPVTFTRKEEDVAIAFTVDSSGSAEIADVRLQATPFVDDQGRPVDRMKLLVDGAPPDPQKGFAVPAFGHVPVRVEAKLSRPGRTYTAHLTLVQGGKAQKPVALTVQRPAAAVTLRDIPVMRAEGGRVVVPLTLQETSGQTVEVKAPQVVGLTRDTGEQVKPGAAAGWTVLESPSSETELTRPFKLQSLRTLGLRIQDLEGPGKYEGTVIVPYGEQTVEKALTVYVRSHVLWALSLITLGVVISWLLRRYLTEERPRLVERQRGEILLEELEESLPTGDLEPREQAVVVSLRGQIGRSLNRLESGFDLAEIKTALNLLGSKIALVPSWILLRRQVRKLEPPELRIEPEGKLEAVERTLLDVSASDAELTARKKVLQDLPGEIKKLVHDHLDTRLKHLEAQVQATAESAGSSIAALLPIQLAPPLERARAALKGERLQEAARALQEAWKAYAWILSNEIGRALGGAKPAVLTEEEWKDLRERANAALAPTRQPDADPERAVAAVRIAQSIYLEGLGTALMRRIDAQLRAIEKDETQKALRERLTKIRADLQQGLTSLGEGKLDRAGRQIAKANTDVIGILQEKGVQLGGEAQLPQDAWVPTPEPGLLARLRFALEDLPDLDLLTQARPTARERIRWYDLLANGAILAIASVLGIPALWAADPAWGGFQDGLTAALWGLGLHQFSYTGIKGLFEKLTA